MTIANLITLGRVLLVPIIVWCLLADEMTLAFFLFVAAGVSDAIDGAVARHFNQQSEFGTVLDPIADKLLLVCVFVVLGLLNHFPIWLTVLVVSRDVIIVAGVILASVMARPVTIKPLWVSKANTAAQIILAAMVLGMLSFNIEMPMLKSGMEYLTGFLTGVSATAYIFQGMRLFSVGGDAATTPSARDVG